MGSKKYVEHLVFQDVSDGMHKINMKSDFKLKVECDFVWWQ